MACLIRHVPPGAANPSVTQANIAITICVSGYTATIRPPSSYTDALKIAQMKAYGLAGSTSDYEEDHLIPLEVGGDPRDPRNLWPEPYAGPFGARQKDEVENYLHSQVCSARLSLADAQTAVAQDWVATYVALHPSTSTPSGASVAPTAAPTPSLPVTNTPSATNVATARLGLSVAIAASRYGFVAASTTSGAQCTARARLPSGNISSAQGLQVTKTADAAGGISWTYNTVSTTTPGTGTHTVTCVVGDQTSPASSTFSVP